MNMALRMITGSSGAGKSHYMYKTINESAKIDKDTNYIVVVPEQFTMETQRDIVNMSENHGVMNIDILSFQRLAYRIMDEVGYGEKLVLEDTGKNLVLRKVIEENKDALIIYKKNVKKPGFTSEMKSMISELLQYGISVSELDMIMDKQTGRELLSSKLKDIRLIYNKFKEYINEKYITAEEILEILLELLDRSEVIKKSVIVFDGFTGFTPVQNKIVQKLMIYAKDVWITVTTDSTGFKSLREHDLFYMSMKTINKLTELAKESDVTVCKPIICNGKTGRFADNEELDFLEKNIFRYGKRVYNGKTKEKPQSIKLLTSINPSEEVRYVAGEIKKMIADSGVRYKDIAVVTGDMERYADYIEDTFKEYDIPCFIDNKRGIMSNPLVEFIRSAILMASQDYSYESVFRFLKTGLTPVSYDDIYMLENYILATGIRGRKSWKRVWKRNYKTRKEKAVDLDKINEIRAQVIEFTDDFVAVICNKNSNVRDITTALFNLMTKANIQTKMQEYINYFTDNKDMARAKEYKLCFKEVISLYDKIVSLLGDEKMELTEYAAILDAGFEEIRVGVIPPSIDSVVVGDIERTRLNHIKVLFFIGVNEGIVPKNSSGGGILTEYDRRILETLGVELAPTQRESSFIDKFYLYLNLTKADTMLYLSYARASSDGKAIRPSYLINMVRRMFPDIICTDTDIKEWNMNIVTTKEATLKYVIEGLNDNDVIINNSMFRELYKWYRDNEEYSEEIRKICDCRFIHNSNDMISEAIAAVLYGKQITSSVTRIEKYAACAFAHFMSYGLFLEKRKIYELAAADMGTLYHESLLRYSIKVKSLGADWTQISEEKRDELIADSVKEVTDDYGNTILRSSHQNEYLISRIEKVVRRTVWALTKQIEAGEFKPGEYEIDFGRADSKAMIMDIEEKQAKMKLIGRIDRLDLCEREDKIYIKIIDYKTGKTTLDFAQIYYGLQLQLILYLDAAKELEEAKKGKEVKTGGMLYYNIKNPLIERDKVSDGDIDTAILKELKPEGLINSDIEVLKMFDKNLTAGVKSDVVPVAINKDGRLSSYSKATDEAKFDMMCKFAKDKIKEFGKDILDGKADVNPYRKDSKTACDYCDYKGICGFDRNIPGFKYRELRSFKDDEFFKCIIANEEQNSTDTEQDIEKQNNVNQTQSTEKQDNVNQTQDIEKHDNASQTQDTDNIDKIDNTNIQESEDK